jgi:hypothetical protein
MSEEIGVKGKMVEGKTVAVAADRRGMPITLVTGTYYRKGGKSVPFTILVLKDGSGIIMQMGPMPGILFKTNDLCKESERILDEALDLRRSTDPEFERKLQRAKNAKLAAMTATSRNS